MAEVNEKRATVDGLATSWLEAAPAAGSAPVLYLHGVPAGGFQWREFVSRTGGFAPDLPGFGASDKPAGFTYSIEGYRDWLDAFCARHLPERFSLVVHDWGVVGLALAQAMPERIERLVICNAVPFLPGYRWHVLARQWRRPVLGEVAMGFTFKTSGRLMLNRSNRDPMPKEWWEEAYSQFDHGTQRAILKLYRSAPAAALAAAGTALGEIRCPALVVWGALDPYIGSEFAGRYADALGGETELRILDDAGHWPWIDEPALVTDIAKFLTS